MTERNIHNKLVRDRIPEIIEKDGRHSEIKILNETEYHQALLRKLVEEANEVATAEEDELVKELADLYEVIDTLLMAFDLNKDTILAIQKKRCDERGGFAKRIKLIWTD